jgi:hypothetical protein
MRATLLIPVLLALLTPAHSQSAPEKALLDLANQSRAEQRLPPLAWDPALAKAARTHLAITLQHPGTLEHQYSGEPDLAARAGAAGAHFSAVAENLAGHAQSPDEIHQSFMNSPAHRHNLLDPKYNAVGIAVASTPAGLIAVQDFGITAAVMSNTAIEQQVQKLLAARGLQPNTSAQATQDARANCETGATPQATANQPAPTLTMQWECTDLSALPPELLQRLPANSQPAKTAAVGACTPKQPAQGFTTYRLAVLIY